MLSDSEEITQKVIHQTTAYLIWLGRNCEKKKTTGNFHHTLDSLITLTIHHMAFCPMGYFSNQVTGYRNLLLPVDYSFSNHLNSYSIS